MSNCKVTFPTEIDPAQFTTELQSHVSDKYLPVQFPTELQSHIFDKYLPVQFPTELSGEHLAIILPGELGVQT